jgi:hypothetical protein
MNTKITTLRSSTALKSSRIKVTLLFIAFCLFLFVFIISLLRIKEVNAAGVPANWQRGVTLFPQSPTDFASANMDLVIQNARDMNANYITLIIPLQQDTWTSSTIYKASYAPDDASLIHAINKAHSLGMKVSLKPHLDPKDNSTWRAQIEPDDRPKWFSQYSSFLYYYADLAQRNGVEQIVVGSELISMATFTYCQDKAKPCENVPENTARWKEMIAQVRLKFSGLLTYSANWGGSYFSDEVDHIGFWSDLDFIGISAYYGLSAYKDPTVSYLMSNWNTVNIERITPVQQRLNKPILFTEIGYRSVDGATINPWDWGLQGPYDPQEQSDAVQAMLQYWKEKNYSWFAGFQYWSWETNPNCSASGDISYSLQNKPAYYSMKYGLSGETPVPFTVTSAVDNGISQDCNNPKTLSFALQRAGKGDVITLANIPLNNGHPTLEVKGSLPPVNKGVQLIGNECGAGPSITINGTNAGVGVDGLTLNDNVLLKGLTITGFSKKQVNIGKHGIKMQCVKIEKGKF